MTLSVNDRAAELADRLAADAEALRVAVKTLPGGTRVIDCGSAVPGGTLYQYVAETDGSTSTYQYDNAAFKLTQAGSWRGDASVKQRLEFFASTRRRV